MVIGIDYPPTALVTPGAREVVDLGCIRVKTKEMASEYCTKVFLYVWYSWGECEVNLKWYCISATLHLLILLNYWRLFHNLRRNWHMFLDSLFWVALEMDVGSVGIWKQVLAAPFATESTSAGWHPGHSPVIARDTQLSLGPNNSAARHVCHCHR